MQNCFLNITRRTNLSIQDWRRHFQLVQSINNFWSRNLYYHYWGFFCMIIIKRLYIVFWQIITYFFIFVYSKPVWHKFQGFRKAIMTLILPSYIFCIKRAGSTLHWVAWLDSTTEWIYSTCCTGTDHATFRLGLGNRALRS